MEEFLLYCLQFILDYLEYTAMLFICTFLHYVWIMRAKRKREAGKLSKVMEIIVYINLPVGLVEDVLLNIFFGSPVFWEWPQKGEWLLTTRLKRHKETPGWRCDRATWLCDTFLNPFDDSDDGHC